MSISVISYVNGLKLAHSPMNFLLKISLLSILMCSLLPGQNSQATDDDMSSWTSPTPLINIINNLIGEINCVRVDRFNPDHLLIGTHTTLYRYDISSNSSQPIAGNVDVWGYREGSGNEAQFISIYDVVQLNQTALIVSDVGNACLRLIINTTTSAFAGNCSARRGHADGTLLESRFTYIYGLLLVEDSIYVADDSRIRQVNLTTQTVSTLNFIGSSSWSSDIKFLTCGHPDCDLIYFTFYNGLASVTRSQPHTVTVLARSERRGDETGSLTQTKFAFPFDLIFINSNQILIGDIGNRKITQVDITSRTSANLYENIRATSVICYKGTLYIGSERTLYSASIIDESNGTECFGKVPNKLHYNQGDSKTTGSSGLNSLVTNDDTSSWSSPTPLINIINNLIGEINCVRVDRFNSDHLLIGTHTTLYRYNIPSSSSQPIAGNVDVYGYKEGSGNEAQFVSIYDVVQLNQTALIVSDVGNACLRLILNTTTSAFAGNCSAQQGHADGTLLESRFSYIYGLLLVKDSIYVADDTQIRQVNLTAQRVSTLNFMGSSPWSFKINFLTCGHPDCDLIYFTFYNGLASVKRSQPHTVTILARSERRGDETGSLTQTKFAFPFDLIFVNSNQILIGDIGNRKITKVDITLRTSSNIYENIRATGMICYKGMLYTGSGRTLYSTSIIDGYNGTECFGKVPNELQYNQGDYNNQH